MSYSARLARSIMLLEDMVIQVEDEIRKEIGPKKRLPGWYRNVVGGVMDTAMDAVRFTGDMWEWRQHENNLTFKRPDSYYARELRKAERI